MKKITTKIISFMLTLSLVFGLSVPAFALDQSECAGISDIQANYILVDRTETKYGTAYYVTKANPDQIQTQSLWDLVDVLMAGASWAKLFSEPSWGNFGWAILDTAALLPVLPSSAYFREGGKVLLKVDEVAKFAKTSTGKKAVAAAMKTFKYSDGITSKATTAIKDTFKKSPQVANQLIAAFEKAADKGLVGASKQTGIKKLTGTVNKIYTHEIKILGEYGAYRIYGYQRSSGEWIFDYFTKAHK